MPDYGVRVTIDVEYDDGIGPAETLNLTFASFVPAEAPAEAVRQAASQMPNKVADMLREAVAETERSHR